MSNFDGIFFLSILAGLASENIVRVTPIFRNGSMVSIHIKYGPKFKYNIALRDSYLLMDKSLKDLTLHFKVDNVKTSFPYNFLNEKFNSNIDLNYVGPIPKLEYFYNKYSYKENENTLALAHKTYSQFKEEYISSSKKKLQQSDLNSSSSEVLNNWSLREETITYCMNDVVGLHQVLVKFNAHIFSKFSMNIHSKPTAASLTFAIFRSNYLPELERQGFYIPLVNGKTYNDIKNSYTGGSTDVFIPSNFLGKIVREYDVNSLYPKNMAELMFMPVVHKSQKYLVYFEGDISLIDKDAFGFFNVEVKTTIDLQHPILQIRKKIGDSTRTISPLGS